MQKHVLLLGSHAKNSPSSIIKMLIESLVFSQYSYALPVWGPALHTDSLSRLRWLHNRSVRLTCDLCKYDHVSKRLGWLPVDSFVRYHSLLTLFRDYYTAGAFLSTLHLNLGILTIMRPDVLSIIYQQFVQGQHFAVRDIFNTKYHPGGIVYLKTCFRTFLSLWQSFCLLIPMCYLS